MRAGLPELNFTLSPSQAATELLRRELAAEGLIDFTRYTFRDYRPAEHHKLIAEKLEAVERGEITRLMIFMPPRHGKSELASKRFPAWFLGRNPNRSIIAASYNSDLAGDFGREVRNIVKSPHFANVFEDIKLAADSQAANRWHIKGGGGYVSAGVGTAVTGRGADVLLIDDPFKDREEADSETIREKVWRWYTSTAYTRLEGDLTEDELADDDIWADFTAKIEAGDAKPFEGAVVVIQTRWHEDDLSGRLIEQEAKGGDQWEKLILPAVMSDGSALWPQKFNIERLKRIEKAIGPRDWSALYQQEPSPDEGTFFERGWFSRHANKTIASNVYICSDYAVTDGDGDYTEHAVWGIGPAGKIYQLDWWHGQTTSDVWIDELLRLIKRWKPICAFGEAGVIAKAIEPMLRRRMIETGTRCRMEWLPSISDKATRARGFQARAAMGEVSLLEGDMGERVLTQLLKFPAGKNDDAVDVCGMIGRALDEAHPAIVPIRTERELNMSGYRSVASEGGDSWRV
jgi:predicted phage terminase large subunit-like protein